MKVFVTSKSFGRTALDAIDFLLENNLEIVRGSKPTLTAAEIAAEIGDCDALVVGNDPVDADVLDAGRNLKLIHMHGTGLDAIDVAGASARGIAVANAPGANSNAVAELTVALMLVAARRIDKHMDVLKSGKWERAAGSEVSGKTVGILGLGSIGRRVARLLKGFEVGLVGYDPYVTAQELEGLDVSLAKDTDAVFAAADFLTLSLPLNDTTRHLVNARRIGLMKPGAIVVNTARGGLIDEDALCDALASGRIAGAALDAFDPEPLARESPLRTSGAVLTPHLAATSIESAAEVSRIVARNVVDILVHGKTACAVNSQALHENTRRD